MTKIYQIKKTTGTSTIYLPHNSYDSSITTVAFGSASLPCMVKKNESDKNILISEDLFDSLAIPEEREVHVFRDKDIIFIGPLIGIFTAGFTDSTIRPIGERSIFFSKILSVQKELGTVCYVFGAHQINWENGTIEAYFYNRDGWYKRHTPLPNVIYDRLPNRKAENHSAFRKIKEKLMTDYQIPFFNPSFFNKWEIHELLVKEHEVSMYLPETIVRPSLNTIKSMLERFQNVFLKPINGSLGLGVLQVLFSKTEKQYYCRYRDEKEENRLLKFSSLEAMLHYFFHNRDKEQYIVQQGIPLLRIEQKPIDFRVHTNKDENGKWIVSAIAAKVSGRGSVTSHISSGGSVKTIDEIFTSKTERTQITTRLSTVAINISKAIDNNIAGNIGEIGFDLGIDKQGAIWLFEANSRPGRSIFSHPKLKESDLLTRKLPLMYSIYLMKKSIHNIEVTNH